MKLLEMRKVIATYKHLLINKITNPFLIYGYAGPDYFCARKEDTQNPIK